MSDPSITRHAPADRTGRWLFAATKGFALAGGLILVALTLMSLASIAGRSLLSMPVPGDYELVQLGIAVAVASFLPFCQMRGGHALVDFFTASARPAARAALDAIGALLVAIVAAVIAWRLAAGAASLHEANDQTMVLGVPTWWAVALMVPSFALFAAAGLYTAWDHWRRRERARADANRS
jgi:TRAP-type C4-dicarboxylate transport system permease small subunit